MCNASAIGGIIQMVGGAASATSQVEAANAAAAQQEFRASEAVVNAQLVGEDIALTQDQAELAKQDVALQTTQLKGQRQAEAAGGSVVVGTGSSAIFNDQIVAEMIREQGRIQAQAELEKRSLEVERQSLLKDAELLRRGAQTTRKTGQLSAVGTFFGSASSAANTFQAGQVRRRGTVTRASDLRSTSREQQRIERFNTA